jgi:hypothetical protein
VILSVNCAWIDWVSLVDEASLMDAMVPLDGHDDITVNHMALKMVGDDGVFLMMVSLWLALLVSLVYLVILF